MAWNHKAKQCSGQVHRNQGPPCKSYSNNNTTHLFSHTSLYELHSSLILQVGAQLSFPALGLLTSNCAGDLASDAMTDIPVTEHVRATTSG